MTRGQRGQAGHRAARMVIPDQVHQDTGAAGLAACGDDRAVLAILGNLRAERYFAHIRAPAIAAEPHASSAMTSHAPPGSSQMPSASRMKSSGDSSLPIRRIAFAGVRFGYDGFALRHAARSSGREPAGADSSTYRTPVLSPS